jgi:fermentation-respiration switch protein FrsA (DUF1100 family)
MGALLLRGKDCAVTFLLVLWLAQSAHAQTPPMWSLATTVLRGRAQTLHLSGPRNGYPVIVSSGDGGWIHLGPKVAGTLAAAGFSVTGFDVRSYLAGFTTAKSQLSPEDVASDYATLVAIAAHGGPNKPILIGVSEGAGLSVLAAVDPRVKGAIGGVIGLGMPDRNELGWRWKDAITWVTHTLPDEPAFSTTSLVGRLAPLPLADIQSTHDEFVPVDEAQRVVDAAAAPKKLWLVNAANHRFSSNYVELERRLLEAVQWVRQNAPSRGFEEDPPITARNQR